MDFSPQHLPQAGLVVVVVDRCAKFIMTVFSISQDYVLFELTVGENADKSMSYEPLPKATLS